MRDFLATIGAIAVARSLLELSTVGILVLALLLLISCARVMCIVQVRSQFLMADDRLASLVSLPPVDAQIWHPRYWRLWTTRQWQAWIRGTR